MKITAESMICARFFTDVGVIRRDGTVRLTECSNSATKPVPPKKRTQKLKPLYSNALHKIAETALFMSVKINATDFSIIYLWLS